MSAVEFFEARPTESVGFVPRVEIVAKVIPNFRCIRIKSIDIDGLRGAIADAVDRFVKTEELRPCGVITSEKK